MSSESEKIRKLKAENTKLKAEVEHKKGWNPPPRNPLKEDPDFFKTHGYAGGGAFPLLKKKEP
jgi:hypothetical protein